MSRVRKNKYLILVISIVVISIVAFIYYQSISPSFDEELEYYFDYLDTRSDLRTIDIRKNPFEAEGKYHIDSWTAFKAYYTNLVKNSPVQNSEYLLEKVSKNELRKIMDSKDIYGVLFDRQEKVIWICWDVMGPYGGLNIGELRETVYYWKKIF